MLRCHGEGGAGDGSDALAEGDTKLVFTTPSRESAPIWESRAYRDVLLDPGGRTFQAAYSPDGGRTSSTRVARIHKVLHDRRACRASTGDPMRHPADAASQSVERSHAGDRSGRGDSDGCATARRAWCLDCDRWRDTRGSPVRTRGDRYEHVGVKCRFVRRRGPPRRRVLRWNAAGRRVRRNGRVRAGRDVCQAVGRKGRDRGRVHRRNAGEGGSIHQVIGRGVGENRRGDGGRYLAFSSTTWCIATTSRSEIFEISHLESRHLNVTKCRAIAFATRRMSPQTHTVSNTSWMCPRRGI